jgi:hypothetical protein
MEWVTCENTYEESWRRLLEYANFDIAIEALINIHGPENARNKSNYRKQAEQIRVSLLQAKEYFEAVKNSSLFTKPNHLYYGSVALSVACMLLRGDGSKSLDFLRKSKINSQHGFDFTFSSNTNRAKSGLDLLEHSFVKIAPNGHFSNWYGTLPKLQRVGGLVKKTNKSVTSTNFERIGSYEISDYLNLVGNKRSLLELIKQLPDMSNELQRYGIKTTTARGKHEISINLQNNKTEHIFTFHSSSSHEDLINILKNFTCENGVCFSIDIQPGATNGFVRTKKDTKLKFSYPDSRETIDHSTIYYEEKISTPEVVDAFQISYGLSMLSRYFPDVWVAFLESHCKGANVVERLTSILTTKIPTLMLSQMSGRQYIISTHRPFWH